MRELKFRVWEKRCKRWWCEDSQYLQMDGTKIHPAPWSTLSADLPDEHIVIQQYTGLKDTNGKDIYEGDIIQLEGSPISYSIEWDRYQWAINAHGALGYDPDWNIQPFNHCVYERAIVVGNIFENSELLKQ
jgi:uncharacterized phage protein (TIGR01671 family)